MPNVDPSNDPGYQKASPADQHQFLMETDQGYAKASPKDQSAYRLSVRQPTQFEKDRQGSSQGGFWGGVKTALGMDAPPQTQTLGDSVKNSFLAQPPVAAARAGYDALTGAAGRMSREWNADKGMNPAARVAGTVAAPLGPLVGVDPDRMRETAETGDTGAVLGQAAVPAAAAIGGLASERIGNALGAAKDATGRAMRTPSTIDARTGGPLSPGELKPWVKALSGPDILGGEKIANALVPKNPDVLPVPSSIPLTESPNYPGIAAGRTMAQRSALAELNPPPELGSPANPGWVAQLPDRMPSKANPVTEAIRRGDASRLPTRMPVPAAPTPELGSPENPGWMAKLPDRMPTLGTPEPELGSPENPGWVTKLPDRMPARPPEKTIWTPDTAREAPTAPSTARRGTKVVGIDSPQTNVGGSYWSFSREELSKAVLSGDRDAAIIYKRRFNTLPGGASYLTDVGSTPTKGLYKGK